MTSVLSSNIRAGAMAAEKQSPLVPGLSGITCSNCNARLLELKRQAMKIMMVEYHKSILRNSPVPPTDALFLSVYEQLHLSEKYTGGTTKEQCNTCGLHLEILKREAILALHTVSIAPFLSRNVTFAPQSQFELHHKPQHTISRTPSFSNTHTGVNIGAEGDFHEIKTYTGPGMSSPASSSSMESGKERVITGKTVDSRCDGLPHGAQTAAIFFAKAAQKFNIPPQNKRKPRKSSSHYQPPNYERIEEEEEEKQLFPTNFCKLLQTSPPGNPPGLFKYVGRRVNGKVKVMLRIAPSHSSDKKPLSWIQVDQRRRQVTLLESKNDGLIPEKLPSTPPTAPKIFAFDAIFEPTATQSQICSTSLLDVLHAVINGGDGCLLVYGAPGLGKTSTMISMDHSTQNLGIMPSAITWLYNLIEDSKQRTGARFSVRVSAVEIVGRSENLKDLLSEQASSGSSTGSSGTSPGIYLREDPVAGVQLSNLSELRAPTADKASFYLDAALASRTNIPVNSTESVDITEYQGSHMIYTLHVYQYRIDKSGRGGVEGGRSRLHLIDLSAWRRNAFKDGIQHSAPSQAALGTIIVGMLNGLKHLPYRDGKITRLLKDSIGNLTCRTTIISHISSEEGRYFETLATLQMAAKIRRSRRKKSKYCSKSSSGGESSCEDTRLRRWRPRSPAVRTSGIEEESCIEEGNSSDYTSSAGEESCDTVVYMGSNGKLDDASFTDNETPPCNVSSEEEITIIEPDSHRISFDDDTRKMNSSPTFGPRAFTRKLEDSKRSSDENDKTNSSTTFAPRASRKLGVSCLDAFILQEGSKTDLKMYDEKQKCSESPIATDLSNSLSKGIDDTKLEIKGGLSTVPYADGNLAPNKLSIKRKSHHGVDDVTGHELGAESLTSVSMLDASNVYVSSNDLELETDNNNNNKNNNINMETTIEHVPPTTKLSEKTSQYVYFKMTTVSEKDLRKKEKRIKKILEEQMNSDTLIQSDLIGTRTKKHSTCMSEYETECMRMKDGSNDQDLSGYCSAPEGDVGRSRLWKPVNRERTYPSPTLPVNSRFVYPAINMKTAEKRELAQCSSSTLSSSSPVKSRSDKEDALIVDKTDETYVASSEAKVKYISANKANITSTKLYRGSLSSLNSSEGQSISPPPLLSRTSAPYLNTANTINLTSFTSSEDRHYWGRYSTVFEEDESNKENVEKRKSKISIDSVNICNESVLNVIEPNMGSEPEQKEPVKRQPGRNMLSPIVKGPACNRQSTCLYPASSADYRKRSPSGCSAQTDCSGIASGNTSSSSRQSLQASPSGSLQSDEEILMSLASPPSRKWFFSRDKSKKSRTSAQSGYFSDGNVTDSSRTSSRSFRRFFGSKSKLSNSGGHSSGYETMHTEFQSGGESGNEGSNKRKRKRFLGFRRSSTSDIPKYKGRTKRSYWIDNTSVVSDEGHMEYKVYHIEDLDKLSSPKHGQLQQPHLNIPKSSLSSLMDMQQRRAFELKQQRGILLTELEKIMDRLMLDKEKFRIKAFRNSSIDDAQYSSELEREVGLLRKRLRVLQEHLQMITCFDRRNRLRRSTSI